MKKLVVFLFLLFFSISAFAQDESLFAENFSLIKGPGENNLGFLNLNILFPPDYLFFKENKRHSKPHQEFQIIKFPRFSKQNRFLGVTTTGKRMQNLEGLYNLRIGQQEDTSSEQESESLAEFYLKRAAERYKKRREIGGTIAIVGGCGLMILGSSMTSREPDDWLGIGPFFGTLTIIMGAAVVGGGIYYLAVPSRAEREHNDVLSISDSAQRERASHEALSLLAARGRRNRILTGILSAAYSVGTLVELAKGSLEYPNRTYEYVYVAGGAALAVYSFVVKSPAERAFEDYLRERKREQQKELRLCLGIMPHGGVKVGFVYSF